MGESFYEQLEELLSFLSSFKERCEREDRKHQSLCSRVHFVQDHEDTYEVVNEHFAALWASIEACPTGEERSVFRRTIQEKLRPFICVGGLNDMVFDKPLGHAGDYLTIYNYFLEYAGTATYEIFINQYSRSIPVAVAHRNRISFLLNEFEGLARTGANVMALGCGPAIEILRASCEPYFRSIDFFLHDPDEAAIEFVRNHLPGVDNVRYFSFSVLQILKALLAQKIEGGPMDLIYCCGLYDYLEDRLAGKLLQALYRNLKPEGKLIITNVNTEVTERAYFEFFAGWGLILRSGDDLAALAEKHLPEASCTVHSDPVNGANIYLTVFGTNGGSARTQEEGAVSQLNA